MPLTPLASGSGVVPTGQLRVSAGKVYWTLLAPFAGSNPAAMGAMTCATTGCGGQATRLAVPGYPGPFVVDSQDIYFVDKSLFGIRRCPLAGCSGDPAIVADHPPGVGPLAQDTRNLYYTTRDCAPTGPVHCTGNVVQIPK
jgi:hypothetical protein